jgi:two-component system response regulator RegX3
MATNVLLVDDDTDYWEVTAYVLRRAGFDISVAPTAKEAEEACKQGPVDLVLLNAQLKDMAALDLCRVLAKTYCVPVLVLSTSRDESDILAAFAAGADDYIIRPFSTRLLVARLEAIHRRATMRPLQRSPRFLRAGNVDIDLDAYSVAVEDRTVHLTRQEFLLLYLLTVNANRIVTPAQLIEFACDATTSPDPALVKTLLSRVRRKLQDAGDPMINIAAISRAGYVLEVVSATSIRERLGVRKRMSPGTLCDAEESFPPSNVVVLDRALAVSSELGADQVSRATTGGACSLDDFALKLAGVMNETLVAVLDRAESVSSPLDGEQLRIDRGEGLGSLDELAVKLAALMNETLLLLDSLKQSPAASDQSAPARGPTSPN